MVCIYCSGKTKVTNSRPQKRLGQTWRRQQCVSCGAIFTTIETVDYNGTLRVRLKDGRLQPFNRDTLFLSLYKALGHRKQAISDASSLTVTIIAQLRETAQNGLLERTSIIDTAISTLKRFDNVASMQYAAYHTS